MTSPDAGNCEDLDLRIRALERSLKRVRVAFVVVSLILGLVAMRDELGFRQTFEASYIFTREFNVPSPREWSAVDVIGGLAPAVDGRSIALWLSGGPLSANQEQIRLELDPHRGQELSFTDKKGKGRLRLGLSSDGVPSIQIRDALGKVVWSAPNQ